MVPTPWLGVAQRGMIGLIGGTLIALAADEIVMCAHAVSGSVDPQLGEFLAAPNRKNGASKTDRGGG
jgi:membrane-bound ClpP family serine protease